MSPVTEKDPHAGQPVYHMGVPIEEAEAVVILLHGRGATAQGMLSLATPLAQEGMAFLAPQAAHQTWYPHSFLAPLTRNEPFLTSALAAVERVVATVQETLPAEHIVLLGFSQGACLAAEFAARYARRWGGLVLFSGGLIGNVQTEEAPPGDKHFQYVGGFDGMPVFIGCSDDDPHIPQERVSKSAEVLQKLGGQVTTRIYPGMGHTISDDELHHAREILKRVRKTP